MSRSKQAKGDSDVRDDPPTERLSKRERRKRLARQLKQDVVQVPIYRDRTVPVGRFIVWSWLKRWLTVAIAVIVILVGPFLGGWYFLRQRDAREAQQLRDVLYREVQGNIDALSEQIRQLDALEAALQRGDPGRVPAFSASHETIRWNQVATRADLFGTQAMFDEFADFYQGLSALDAAFDAYADGKAVWQWASRESGRSAANATQDLVISVSELRTALSTQRLAGQTLLARVRPTESLPSEPAGPDVPAETADDGQAAAAAVSGSS